MRASTCSISFFFFNDTATTEIYTLSLHDALPICCLLPIERDRPRDSRRLAVRTVVLARGDVAHVRLHHARSEEHTSELQSRLHLVCRLLLEKKNKSYTERNELAVQPIHLRQAATV